MTAYTTRTLAEIIIGEGAVEENAKAATRTLRKFLRAETVAKGGKVGTDTPGKGGRYQIDLNKREVTAMAKRFAAWQKAEEEAAKARRDALAKIAKPAASVEVEAASDEAPEGDEPTDLDLDEMIKELQDESSDEVDA